MRLAADPLGELERSRRPSSRYNGEGKERKGLGIGSGRKERQEKDVKE